jgi:hypothetical protein
MKWLIIGAALAFVALPAAAADDIDCGAADLVKSSRLKIELSVDPAVWDGRQGSGEQEFLYFSRDGKAAFAIITEEPAVDLHDYHDSILAFATENSGAADPVTSYDDAQTTINGKTWSSMHYDVKVEDQPLEFLNYYYSEQGLGSTQFIFWSLPEDAAAVQSDFAGKVMPTVTIIE